MKAWKYTLTLFLGLGMFGFGARVQAQTVQPATDQDAGHPQRGIPMPTPIETMMETGDFAKALSEFEKYTKTLKSNPCDVTYLNYVFYSRMSWSDTAKAAFYQEKSDSYADQFLQACGNTVEAYLLKDRKMMQKDPDSTVAWMTKAIEIDPSYDVLYMLRGSALWELKRTEEACADFKKAKEMTELYGEYYDTNCVESKDAAEEATETPAE